MLFLTDSKFPLLVGNKESGGYTIKAVLFLSIYFSRGKDVDFEYNQK
jgi:hypothetical protein